MYRLIALAFAFSVTACGGGNSESTPTAPSLIQSGFSPTIVVLEGDSLIQISAATSWPTAVQAESKWLATWKNFAVGGSTTTMMLSRYENVRANKPNRTAGVFIFNGGSNDLNYPHGEDPALEIYGHLKTMWSQARADGFKVVAFTIHNGGSYISPEFAKVQFARLNTMIRSDPLLYDALIENDKLFPDTSDKMMLSDGLHFTPAANEKERVAVEVALSTLK